MDMNKIDMEALEYTLKHGPSTTLVETVDFFKARDFLNNETKKNGFGVIISNPIFAHRYISGGPCGECQIDEQHRYIISNLVKSYYGEDELIPFAEYGFAGMGTNNPTEKISYFTLPTISVEYLRYVNTKNALGFSLSYGCPVVVTSPSKFSTNRL